MYKTSRTETPHDPTIPARPGWEGMFVHWLADRDHGNTETTVFNVTEFPPKRSHEVHRHPHAEEYFFVLEGSGLHLTDGDPVRLEKGTLSLSRRANGTDSQTTPTEQPLQSRSWAESHTTRRRDTKSFPAHGRRRSPHPASRHRSVQRRPPS